MKQIHSRIILFAFSTLIVCLHDHSFASSQQGPVGFASLGSGTSGGDPSTVCPVEAPEVGTNIPESNLRLAIACTQKQPRMGGIVVFPKDKEYKITVTKAIDLPSNITIQGPIILETNAARVFGISAKQNVIIKNITFKTISGRKNGQGFDCPSPLDPNTAGAKGNEATTGCTNFIEITGFQIPGILGVGDYDENAQFSENIWIDHNSFSQCGDKCIVIKNGNRKDKSGRWSGADKITISNNKFSDSFYSILVTVIDAERGLRGLLEHSTSKCALEMENGILPRMRVTIHGNLFERIRRRSARASYCTARVHQFNNVINGFGLPLSKFPVGHTCYSPGVYGFGPSALYGAQLLLENNDISAWPDDPNGCKRAVNDISHQKADGSGKEDTQGYVVDSNNIYREGAFGVSSSITKVFKPEYDYTLLEPSQVYQSVLKNAGPQK